MADIRCSHCGKDNPDFFDVCQFCQSPLKSESMLHAGDAPSQKDTGELEPILPEWLQDARQQSRDSVENTTFNPETKPRSQNEPVDLLAGLTSQDDSDEDEIPDWLTGINQVEDKRSVTDNKEEESSDFFSQFSETESKPSKPVADEPVQDESADAVQLDSGQVDELGGWLSQTSAESGEPFSFDQAGTDPEENNWMKNLGSPGEAESETPKENEPEDLSWLRDLEVAAKQTGELSPPPAEAGFNFESTQPDSAQEDMSWLNNLGGTSTPAAEQPDSSSEDLSWLNKMGGTPFSSGEESAPAESESPQDNLGWLNNLGGPSESTAEEPAPEKQDSAQDDLSWLNNLGGAFSSQDTQTPESSTSKPFRTAPLNELTEETKNDTTPDWLRNAMEEPSMPAPGDLSMDWFKEQDKAKDIPPALSTDDDDSSSEPVPALTDIDLPVNDAPSFSAQDVDSMFNIDMPDWLTQDSGGPESPLSKSTKTPANAGESLDPVELPSWVQAMRPVDSAIEGTSATEESEQVPEREGPLAGFRGIIPSAPIGSSLRPKAFSLKLQVTDEQETGASLIEQIIVGEAAAHPKKSTKAASSQRALRWMISILFLGILSVIIGIGSQSLGIFPPGRVSELSNLIGAIPDGSPVLLVMDYDPSVAGELAAAAGPVLDQMALVRHSTFTFLAMSPNGPAMVEHLMLNTGIGRDVSAGGLGYQAEANYFNLGFLPGGSAGVLGFVSAPERAFPQVNVDGFTEFEAVVLLTDSAESGRVWVEQLEFAKQARPEIASKPLIVVSSAQAGPMLEPYVSSGQVDVLVNGLSDAAKYEFVNQSRPGMARAYWDSFGVGLMLAVLSIVLGGIWNFFIGIRERRAIADLG